MAVLTFGVGENASIVIASEIKGSNATKKMTQMRSGAPKLTLFSLSLPPMNSANPAMGKLDKVPFKSI